MDAWQRTSHTPPRVTAVPSSTGTYPAAAPDVVPRLGTGDVGGRFIGRGRLALKASYWLGI